MAAGSRPNKLTRRCPNVVPSGSRGAATDDARCHGKLKKPGNRPAIDIAGKPALRDELLRLYAIGQGQSTEDKLSAKQAHTILKNKKAPDGTRFFSRAKEATNGRLPREEQIKAYFGRPTNKRK